MEEIQISAKDFFGLNGPGKKEIPHWRDASPQERKRAQLVCLIVGIVVSALLFWLRDGDTITTLSPFIIGTLTATNLHLLWERGSLQQE